MGFLFLFFLPFFSFLFLRSFSLRTGLAVAGLGYRVREGVRMARAIGGGLIAVSLSVVSSVPFVLRRGYRVPYTVFAVFLFLFLFLFFIFFISVFS